MYGHPYVLSPGRGTRRGRLGVWVVLGAYCGPALEATRSRQGEGCCFGSNSVLNRFWLSVSSYVGSASVSSYVGHKVLYYMDPSNGTNLTQPSETFQKGKMVALRFLALAISTTFPFFCFLGGLDAAFSAAFPLRVRGLRALKASWLQFSSDAMLYIAPAVPIPRCSRRRTPASRKRAIILATYP